jgi:hypothetical protein
MKTSETINEISTALAKAQGELKNPSKDKENPHFKSTYADLASGINAIREALSKHGIAYVQGRRMDGNILMLDTRLTHSSGQWIEDEAPVIMFPAKPQDIMSATTYARRGSLFALAGIAGDDDDGNEANKHEIGAPQRKTPTPPKPPMATMTQDQSQVSRDIMLSAIDMSETVSELVDWATQNKTVIDKLLEADRQAVREAFGDKKQALMGRREAAE